MWKLAVTTSTVWLIPFRNFTEQITTMSKPATAADGFATAMQQLSAEAERNATPVSARQALIGSPVAEPSLQSLEARLENLETTLSKKLDDLGAVVRQNRS